MHFYAWKKGLKTGMYYLRSTAAADAIKFTVDKAQMQQPVAAEVIAGIGIPEIITVQEAVAITSEASPTGRQAQHTIPYEQLPLADYDQKRADMACSLDNPDACEACGS